MEKLQIENVARSLAEHLHYSICWSEPMNGDDIEYLVETLNKELKYLNGDV